MMLKSVFQSPYRQVAGFTKSLLKLMQIKDLKTLIHTQLCRRGVNLKIEPYKVPKGGPIHITFDSTGVKVYGEGERSATAVESAQTRYFKAKNLAKAS